MEQCVQVFKDFYEETTKHRKLSWMYTLGNCTVKGHFDARTLELVLSTLQASVLLAFNQGFFLISFACSLSLLNHFSDQSKGVNVPSDSMC